MPTLTLKDDYTPATYNDPALTQRLASVFEMVLGKEKVQSTPPVMAGEDFSRYGLVEPKIPSLIFWLGAVDPKKYEESIL